MRNPSIDTQKAEHQSAGHLMRMRKFKWPSVHKCGEESRNIIFEHPVFVKAYSGNRGAACQYKISGAAPPISTLPLRHRCPRHLQAKADESTKNHRMSPRPTGNFTQKYALEASLARPPACAMRLRRARPSRASASRQKSGGSASI